MCFDPLWRVIWKCLTKLKMCIILIQQVCLGKHSSHLNFTAAQAAIVELQLQGVGEWYGIVVHSFNGFPYSS